MKALMTLEEAAAETPWSVDTLRAAIRQPKGTKWPPLEARIDPARRKYLVTATALADWIDRFENA